MFAQKPVVATSQGGSLEMIQENVSGFFIPTHNAKASSEILMKLLLDKKVLKGAGIEGLKRAKELFSVSTFRQNWLRIING